MTVPQRAPQAGELDQAEAVLLELTRNARGVLPHRGGYGVRHAPGEGGDAGSSGAGSTSLLESLTLSRSPAEPSGMFFNLGHGQS